jgi:hypothetical protein
MAATPLDLPRFLVDLVDNPPKAGDGVHNWLFRVARNLHAHMSQQKMFNLMKAKVKDCGRRVPDDEIDDAITNS